MINNIIYSFLCLYLVLRGNMKHLRFYVMGFLGLFLYSISESIDTINYNNSTAVIATLEDMINLGENEDIASIPLYETPVDIYYPDALLKQNKYVREKLSKIIEDYLNNRPWAKCWRSIESAINKCDLQALKNTINPKDHEFKSKLSCPLFLSKEAMVYIATPLICCAQKNFYEGVQYLIEKGAQINEKTKFFYELKLSYFAQKLSIQPSYYLNIGLTALHFAVMNGNADIVKLLVEKGAQINLGSDIDPRVTSGKLTPLHLACMNPNKVQMFEIVKYLIEHGAQLNLHDIKGFCALDFLMQRPSCEDKKLIIEYLNKKGLLKSPFLFTK